VSEDSRNSSVLAVGNRHLRAVPDSRTVEVESVSADRLDRIWPHVAGDTRRPYLKIDTQGYAIPTGSAVALLWGAANRDERRWERADELELTREPRRNLAFGEGIHHCLGAPLARLQGRVVLEEASATMPDYRLAGEPERIATHNTRGIARLPIVPA
jgi:cytochrome P450